jgi:outer membrane lipoprotein-sorting protein
MGSDFTYGDLERKEDKGAKNARLPDEQIGSDAVYVLETTPGSAEAAGYAKVRTWVRKTDFIPIRTKFFDPSGKVVKTLYVKRVRDFDGKPTVVEAVMKSENGHSTELIVDSLERRDDIPDSEFSPDSLDR